MKIRNLIFISTLLFIALAVPDIAYGTTTDFIYCSYQEGGNATDCPDCTSVTKIIQCPTDTYCDCSACKNNATPTSKTIQTGANSYTTISECPKSISGGEIIGGVCPDECPNKTWTDVTGKNYQTKCGGTILKPACEYQCNKGYYGSGTSCTQCPSSGGVYGTTTSAGATSITECYIPGGTAFSDGTGNGTYTSDCYYQQ